MNIREPNPPSASVIIPCRNAAATLKATLEALLAQTFRGVFEVIIVNNHSQDETVAMAQRFQQKFPHCTIVDALQQQGAGYARNVGVSFAKADLVLFCDADDIPDIRWVASMTAALGTSELIGGRTEWKRLNHHQHPFALEAEGKLDVHYMGVNRIPCVGAGNLGIQRKTFERLGGFDPELPVHEDCDLCLRAHECGISVKQCPEAIMHVRARAGLLATYRQGCSWGYWSGLLFAKHAKLLGRRSTFKALLGWPWLLLRLLFIFRQGRATTWAYTAGWKFGQTAYELGIQPSRIGV
ncbi:MAG: glycosyltransferase [Opitutales bacterium]|nr:glycosyltransferase [Opitutales bacterium]